MELALGLTTAHNHVYAKLRELISSRGVAAGERLDERALARALGVSRTPVREAISRLVSDGLIEHRPYQGNFVRRFTAEQVAGLYDVRGALEALAVREASGRLTDETLDAIRSALGTARAAHQEGDTAAFADADRVFHRILAKSSGNEALIQLLDNLDARIQLVRAAANRNPELVERTIVEREQILEALEARNADRAAALIVRHIDDVKQTVVQQLTVGAETAPQPT